MTTADIIWEFRQIRALEYEKKTGKPYREDDDLIDATYKDYQRSLGIVVDDDDG